MSLFRSFRNASLFGLTVLLANSPGVLLAEEAPPENVSPELVAEAGVVTGGPVVRWAEPSSEFQSPSHEAVTAVLAEFNARMAAKFANGEGVLAPVGEAQVKILPNGLRMARMTADQLNVSLVRVDTDGGLVGICSDSPSEARQALSTTTTTPASEE